MSSVPFQPAVKVTATTFIFFPRMEIKEGEGKGMAWLALGRWGNLLCFGPTALAARKCKNSQGFRTPESSSLNLGTSVLCSAIYTLPRVIIECILLVRKIVSAAVQQKLLGQCLVFLTQKYKKMQMISTIAKVAFFKLILIAIVILLSVT